MKLLVCTKSGAIVQIKWLRKALLDLNAETQYIANDNIDIANDFYKHIHDSVAKLVTYNNIGRAGRVFGTRELVIKKYPFIIPYRVKNNEIQILRIFHTSRILQVNGKSNAKKN